MTRPALFTAALLASFAALAQKPDAGQPAGTLTKEEVQKVVNRHQNEVKSCFEQALRLKPNLEGKVAVMFNISAAGDVTEAMIDSDTLQDANTTACMLTVVRTWKFPEPKGGGPVTVTYPWVFKPTGPAKK